MKKLFLFLALLFTVPLHAQGAPAPTAMASLGQTVTLSVTAQGTQPFTYQWAKNGTLIVGATNSTLVLPNVQLSDAATYVVTVSNTWGSTTATGTVGVIGLPPSAAVMTGTAK